MQRAWAWGGGVPGSQQWGERGRGEVIPGAAGALLRAAAVEAAARARAGRGSSAVGFLTAGCGLRARAGAGAGGLLVMTGGWERERGCLFSTPQQTRMPAGGGGTTAAACCGGGGIGKGAFCFGTRFLRKRGGRKRGAAAGGKRRPFGGKGGVVWAWERARQNQRCRVSGGPGGGGVDKRDPRGAPVEKGAGGADSCIARRASGAAGGEAAAKGRAQMGVEAAARGAIGAQ